MNRSTLLCWRVVAVLLLACICVRPGNAADDRIIVKWRALGPFARLVTRVQDRTQHFQRAANDQPRSLRPLYDHADLIRLNHTPSSAELAALLARLRQDPAVEFAEADGYRYIADFPLSSLPNDPYFAVQDTATAYGALRGQWYLQAADSTVPAAANVTGAWSTTHGASSVVVAVIDTGIVESHPDFNYGPGVSPAKLLCSTASGSQVCGYNFVSCDQGSADTFTSSTSLSGTLTYTNNAQDCTVTSTAATYNFSNKGMGWAPDASDPGDWLSTTDVQNTVFSSAGCTTTSDSTWHGTKVAGIIGAIANNGVGIAGVAPLTTLLPIRVVGKCSARTSDLAAAILWAAGIPVTVNGGNAIASSTPANIINISLASNEPCSATEQDAIDQVTAQGILVIAAAGNEGGPLDAPANCNGVLSVVGLTHLGTKASYSSLGLGTNTVAAPSGDCVNTGTNPDCLYGIETTTNSGSAGPGSDPGAYYTFAQMNQPYVNAGGNALNGQVVGTSFAAPMVSGTLALMLAAHPGLSASQLTSRLVSAVTAFPTSAGTTSAVCASPSTATTSKGLFSDTSQNVECLCTTATCGSGMLNAAAAVQISTAAFVQIFSSKTVSTIGEKVSLDGGASTAAAGHSIVSYQWTSTPATSNQFTSTNTPKTTFLVPSFSSFTLTLTITDDAGNRTSGSVYLSATGSGSGSSGGGTLGPGWLLLLGLLTFRLRSGPKRRTLGN